MKVPCDAAPGQSDFRDKSLVTETSGDIKITVSATAPPTIECAKPSKACEW